MNVYGTQGVGVMVAASRGRLPFVQKVYGLFLLGILAAVLGGGALFMGPSQMLPIAGRTIEVPSLVLLAAQDNFLLFIGAIVLLFALRAVGRMPGLNVLVMCAFCAAMGVMVTPQIYVHTVLDAPGTVGLAASMTVAMFIGLSAFAMLSRRDFNFLGAGLFVALWGMIIGGLLNGIFFHSPWAYMAYAWIGLVVFSGFVIFDTSNILRRCGDDDAVFAAVSLFLDAINLFLLILRIVGGRRR